MAKKSSKQPKVVEKIIELPKSIFVIKSRGRAWHDDKAYFATLERAREELKLMAAERKYNMGVHCFEQTEDEFSYLLGWEENYVKFHIEEIALKQ